MTLVDAIWIGPAGCSAPDGRELVPGETVVRISAGEAKESDNWRPVKQPKPDSEDKS